MQQQQSIHADSHVLDLHSWLSESALYNKYALYRVNVYLILCFQNQDYSDMRGLQRVWRCRQIDLEMGKGGVKVSTWNRPLSP